MAENSSDGLPPNRPTMIPSLGACKRRMTAGERRFAERLQAKLEPDYLVWYDVPLGRRRLHPDFVILHPSRGLLVLEVKDWKLDTLRSINPTQVELGTNKGLVRELRQGPRVGLRRRARKRKSE